MQAFGTLNDTSAGRAIARMAALLAGILLIVATGGDGPGPKACSAGVASDTGVFTGFCGDLNWDRGATSEGQGGSLGIGEGADGFGGFGGGGFLGQFRGALVKVYFADGSLLGEATTATDSGMVTIKPGQGFQGALLVEIHGQPDATYFDEAKDTHVPFPPGTVIHAIVPNVTRNIGLTPFSEAAYQLSLHCMTGRGTAEVCGSGLGQVNQSLPGEQAIKAANNAVVRVINQQFPAALAVDDVTRLPVIVAGSNVRGVIDLDARGKYSLVNTAFSKQAGMYNNASEAPTLVATRQISADLLDGTLDGMVDGVASVPASARTYDPHTLTTELSSALAQQTSIYGTDAANAVIPPIVSFGNVRYDSYYFDAKVSKNGAASTIAIATESSTPTRSAGQETAYVPGGDARGFLVYGNMGSGSLFIKKDSPTSETTVVAVGDNVNGELGDGTNQHTERAPALVALPGTMTHAAGGFGHTVVRLSDGSVYAFGDNSRGQLGSGMDGTALPNAKVPLRVNLPAPALAVSATNAASFALLDDGRVYSWGSGWGFGSLGDGAADGLRTTPAPVLSTDGELKGVVQISARDNDVIVLKADGSVWTWGSFSQSIPAGAPLPRNVVPGNTVATRVTGLPTGRVRKVMTEQGLFAALIGSGTDEGRVYAWGIHFDLTAADFLYDLTPQIVLNLPPVRDLMPGGFLGYGQRPFDRMTAMAVDFSNRYWKLRGRVAERYDPDFPTRQRRPVGQAPRPDCASCHTVRPNSDVVAPALAGTAPVCQPPSLHTGLITTQTDCTGCHNGATLSNGTTMKVLDFCRRPDLPTRVEAPAIPAPTERCGLTVGHPVTPPGTFCASCHNDVTAVRLTCSQDQAPSGPPSTTVPVIAGAQDNAGAIVGNVANGAVTDDATPVLFGSLSAPLLPGERLIVLRNGVAETGAPTFNGSTTWTYAVPSLADGNYTFTANVTNAEGRAGTSSNEWQMTVSTGPVVATARIVSAFDNVAPSRGAVSSGQKSDDPRPVLSGSVAGTLAGGNFLRLWRDGSPIADFAPTSSTTWQFAETTTLTASSSAGTPYRYTIAVASAAGSVGVQSPEFVYLYALPADRDADGFVDDVDLCPGIPGIAPSGCPEDLSLVVARSCSNEGCHGTGNGFVKTYANMVMVDGLATPEEILAATTKVADMRTRTSPGPTPDPKPSPSVISRDLALWILTLGQP